MPFITEEIYQGLYAKDGSAQSMHKTDWPIPTDARLRFADSTMVEVSKNHRADDHKVAKALAAWARTGRAGTTVSNYMPALTTRVI